MSNQNRPRLVGVLLAAGRGRRMNGAKQFEPWPSSQGTKPLVAASYDAVQPVCDDMIVVLGHRASEVVELLAERTFQSVISDADAPMFESIRTGLRTACSLDSNASVLLHLGDHPEVAITTLQFLIEASQSDRDRAVLPVYRGQGGHPVLIPPRVIQLILAAEGSEGLRRYWIDHPELCQRINVDDKSSIQDVDYSQTEQ
jgi:molybdenum cofactor cytidylyltransferase